MEGLGSVFKLGIALLRVLVFLGACKVLCAILVLLYLDIYRCFHNMKVCMISHSNYPLRVIIELSHRIHPNLNSNSEGV